MRLSVAVGALIALSSGCGRMPNKSELKYDSYHSIALDGTIDNGVIITSSSYDSTIRDQILTQLRYSVGFLNGYQSVGDISKTLTKSIVIKNKEQLPNGDWKVTYSANMIVSWARGNSTPSELQLILPESTDYNHGMPQKFYDKYAVPECLASDAHDLGLFNFWYYIRPEQRRCALGRGNSPAELSIRFPIHLKVSAINTTGKSPEYTKIWEDGRLVVTAAFSTNVPGSGPIDIGVREYGSFYNRMVSNYGQPTLGSETIPAGGPGLEQPIVHLEFQSNRGPVEVHMFLVDGLSGNGSSFDREFGAATLTSDLILYNGHANLGGNVHALARIIQIKKGQYHLIMLNNCDTFAYIDDEFAQRHKAANPDAPDYKFVDIISNSMPSLFSYNAESATTVVRAATSASQTYRQILSGFNHFQHPSVIGEEDNG